MRSLGVCCFLVFCLICCVLSAKGQECTPTGREWFGSRNQYKCHCTNNGCNTTGTCCGRDTCESGWFGPACQYVNLVKSSRFGATVHLDGQSSRNDWLTDSNDTTCNTDSTSHNLTVTFNAALPFTWLRLAVNNSTLLKDFVLKFRDSSGSTVDCHRLRNATVTRKILDVHCEVNETIQAVMLIGNGVSSLCSLHVSGGRNVALKQETNQTSSYIIPPVTLTKSRAENAVDGNPSGIFDDGSCTHTMNKIDQAWILNLSSEMVVNRYRIYNRVDGNNQGRLRGFQIESLNSRSQITFNDANPFNNAENVYDIISNNLHSVVKSVIIFRNDNESKILTLCEVEVYGDSICNGSTYGRECELSCRCQNNSEKCFTSTGGCPSGCRAGYYGEGCMTECESGYFGEDCADGCSEHCINGTCNAVSGHCHGGCSEGYKPPQCVEQCDPGFYDLNCSQNCSERCLNQTCNATSGQCFSCIPGYQGDFCDEAPDCPAGWYGSACDQPCPERCADGTCDQLLGFCASCQPGWKGVNCDQECASGRYGQDCAKLCSFHCINGSCDPVYGDCIGGCSRGYKPPDCVEECDPGYHGYNCSDLCPVNCLNSTCNASSGLCSECVPGYQGDDCSQECGSGYFGVDCQQNCSQDCFNQLCHHVTGRCSNCSPGKTGDICQEDCQSGTYGDRCINKCSPECKDDVACDIKSGACPNGCEPGYTEPLCVEECKPQTYGLGCSQNCSSLKCKVNTTLEPKVCHHASGECLLGCESGYEGLTCSKVISKGTNVGAIVGPIILLILVVIAVFVVVFVWRRRKRTKGNNLLDHGSQADVTESAFSNPGQTKTGRSGSVPGDKKVSKDNNGFEPPPTGDTDDVAYFNVGPGAPAPGTSIAVDELSSYMASHAKDFFVSQFSKIPTSCNAPTSIGLNAENKHKNRYKNICAYDHSRVLLNKEPDKKHGDYINASYVHGYKDEEKYIASQGPNKVILEDFVRMLWEQKVDKVVMLTKLVEEGRHKCEQYWPEDGEVEFDEIKVRLAATQVFADYTIRRLQLIKVGGHPIHSITHFHFTSWPDKGVPPSPWALVDFEQRVASYPSTQPIVVHCSAGVGRTGTFIALRKVMREAEDTGHMDFYNTLWSLRQDRVYMIQTAEQYMFLHEAAQVAMVCMGTTITSEDISDRMKTLHSTLPSGQTKLEQEFKAVCNVCAGSEENQDDEGSGGSIASMYQNSRSVNNRLKNRFNNILPKESYRPFLSLESKDNGDYINAVLLPDFTKQNKQILTQLPLTTTVLDLWRLVLQYKVNLIVAFDLESDDSTIGSYLPSSETEPLHCGPFDIESQPPTSDSDDSLWVAQKLSVIYHKKKKMRMSTSSTHTEEHFLTHIKCTASKLDPEKLLNFVTQTKACKPETEGRTVYMCRNGATYSGLACVLSLLLDRLDNDHQLTVPLVVGAIKTVRPQVIPTLEQYSSLYQALQIYIDNASVYTNFAGAEPPANLPIMEVNNQAFEQDQSDDVNVYANS